MVDLNQDVVIFAPGAVSDEDKKQFNHWSDYLKDIRKGNEVDDTKWEQGFVCGLASAGVITENVEEHLLAWLYALED